MEARKQVHGILGRNVSDEDSAISRVKSAGLGEDEGIANRVLLFGDPGFEVEADRRNEPLVRSATLMRRGKLLCPAWVPCRAEIIFICILLGLCNTLSEISDESTQEG